MARQQDTDVDQAYLNVKQSEPKAKRICLVTSELAGPDYNGGIGTAVRGLALSLARNGYGIDVLYTRVDQMKPHCFRGSFHDQVEAYRKLGINLVCLAHDGVWNDWLGKSYQVMVHLTEQAYDHVFFNDMHGEGYYSLLGRATAHPALTTTTMSVVLHSSTQWIAELNQQAVTSIESVRLMEMERRCVELADAVISPSAYILGKYEGYGWTLPATRHVIQNLLPMGSERTTREVTTRRVDEIVFFGRLERRKGLFLFCDAIERIKREIGNVKITFLGKLTEEDGELTGFPLLKRAAAWPFEFKLLNDFDREQALSYLRAGHRVAVMPAPEDNSPCAIMECLYLGVPFVAASGSGGQELIDRGSWDENLFEPTVEALTAKLRSVLQHGVRTGTPARLPEQNEEAILGYLARMIRRDETLDESQGRQGVRGSVGGQSPPYHIILLATSQRNPAQDAVAIQSAISLYPASAGITVLTADRNAIVEGLSRFRERRAINVVDAREFKTFLNSLSQDPHIVGVCHVSEPITPEWLGRAELCFRTSPEIRALTGLSGVTRPAQEDLSGYFRPRRPARQARSYRIGNSPVLFPLAADTNDGFMALRSDVLGKVTGISPFDDQYDRFKGMRDWVHDVVVKLAQDGERFEVLVDPLLEASLKEEPCPIVWFGRTARSHSGSGADFGKGSERALMARLAIETQLAAQKTTNAAACLAHMSDKLGRRVDDPSLYISGERMARTLATMARAAGQVELAHDLIADHLIPSRNGDLEERPLASVVGQRSREIRLFDLVAAGACSAFNLTHDWSFKVISADREVEVHPNTYFEGRATLVFSDLDLTDIGSLRGMTRVASPFSRPVRFRIDILSKDGSSRFSLERVVRAGEVMELDEPLPPEVQTRCDVSLSTEMESPMDQTEGAWARWVDLRLTGASGPSRADSAATVSA